MSVRFRLNTATNQGKIMMNEREFSLWVGDLTPEVDDYTLYKTFAAKYTSIKAAKVILDASGYSKGFGFLRFGSEEEQKHCLIHMNGYKGLGMKPLKISNAIPKAQRAAATNGSSNTSASSSSYPYSDYSQYYDPNSYWQNYSQWGGYGYDPNTGSYNYDPSTYAQQYSQYQQQYNQAQYQQYSQQYSQYYQQQQQQQQNAAVAAASNVPPVMANSQGVAQSMSQNAVTASGAQGPTGGGVVPGQTVSEESEIVEHTPPLDVDKENLELAEPLINFWTHTSLISNEFNVAMNNEYEKLNFIEVTIPPIKKKLENGPLAKKIVLSHNCEMKFEDWERRFEEKQKLLSGKVDDEGTESSSSEESDEETQTVEETKAEDDKKEVEEKPQNEKPSSHNEDEKMETEDSKNVPEDSSEQKEGETKKRKTDDTTEMSEDAKLDSPSQKKRKLSESVEQPIEKTEGKPVESQEATNASVDRSRLFSVMADVDVNVLMADTESVSSKPTSESEGGSDSSDSELEAETNKEESKPDVGTLEEAEAEKTETSREVIDQKVDQVEETNVESSKNDESEDKDEAVS